MAEEVLPHDVSRRRAPSSSLLGRRRGQSDVILNPLREDAFFRWSIVAYLFLRLISFERGVERLGDTPSYLHHATLPIFSREFLAGDRAFTVPLLWKLVPGGTPADVAAQVALSVASWLVLAFVVAGAVSHPVARRVSLWLVLLLSLTNVVITWDHDLLSESVSLSLTAALLAAVLVLVRRPTWTLLAVTLAIAFFWTFSRDSNVYAAVVAIPVLLFVLARRPERRALAAVALVGTLAIAAASIASARIGGREEQPVRDVIFLRLRTEDPAALSWLRAHGFRDFNADNARIYRDYLLHHPVQALVAPLEPKRTTAPYSSSNRVTALWTPHVAQYDRNRFFARVPRQIQDVLFPLHPVQLLLELLLVLAAAAFAVRRSGLGPAAAVAFAALACTYPQMVVVWNVSGQEVDRHALVAALVVRVAAVVLAAFALDALYEPVCESVQAHVGRLRARVLGEASPPQAL
jgi:hypothetical protein